MVKAYPQRQLLYMTLALETMVAWAIADQYGNFSVQLPLLDSVRTDRPGAG